MVRVSLGAFATAVGLDAVAGFELSEVSCCKRPALLGDRGQVGSSIVDPGALCWLPLGEEDDIGLGAGRVRVKCAARKTKYRVDVAIFHQHLKDIAGLVCEKNIVRDH